MSMDSIDKKQKKLLLDIFNKDILPLQNKITPTITKNFDRNSSSCFVIREKVALDNDDFELDLSSEESVVKALEKMWQGSQKFPIAKKIMSIKQHFTDDKDIGDPISPFVYEMF